MSKSTITMRHLSVKDVEQYNNLLRYAFQVTEEELMEVGWENDDIRQSKFGVLERASVLGCFDGKNLVSQFAVYPLNMNIYNAVYPIGFITSVATYPEYSGQGLMRKLMHESLVEMKENKQSLALLYPYSIPLYRHRGFEIVSNKMTYAVPDRQIPKNIEVDGYVRRVSQDSKELRELHTEFARQTHGCLFRNHLAWEEYWRWDVDDTLVAIYYDSSDEPLGYMVYLIKEDIMHIKEMIYLNEEGRQGLWQYIHAHDSMIDEVRGNNYFSEPIAFDLYDSDIKETIRPYVMGRIIDVEMFLSDYRFNHAAEGKALTLHVEDPFLAWNNRTFHFTIHHYKAVMTDTPSSNEFVLSIGTLTTLLLGYKSADRLYKTGRIQATAQTIRLLDQILRHEKPYISDYI